MAVAITAVMAMMQSGRDRAKNMAVTFRKVVVRTVDGWERLSQTSEN